MYKNYVQKKYKDMPKIWELDIPKIHIKAQINDGTDSDNLNKYIAHFIESAYLKGNICLAAHNRGYDVNYFRDLKYLENGDEIIYKLGTVKLKYIVTKSKIIKDTDVEVIENTKENKITLITCVEGEPEKRRCVVGTLSI